MKDYEPIQHEGTTMTDRASAPSRQTPESAGWLAEIGQRAVQLPGHQRAVVILLVLFAVLSTIINLTNPMFESQDEANHYRFIHYVWQHGSLPIVDLTDENATEYHQAPLYYVVAAITGPLHPASIEDLVLPNTFWGYIVARQGRDNKNQLLHDPHRRVFQYPYLPLHIIRAISTLFGVGIGLMVYQLARQFLDEWLAMAIMAVAIFTPSFVAVSSSISNDPPVVLLATLSAFLLIRLVGQEAPPPWTAWIASALALGATVLVKTNAWVLLPLSAVAATLVALRHRSWRLFVTAGLILLGGFLLLDGWWILRNLRLYGDATGLSALTTVYGQRTNQSWTIFRQQMETVRQTYWAAYGHSSVRVPDWVYPLMDALVLAGLAGLIVRLIRAYRDIGPTAARRDQIMVVSLWVVMSVANLIWWSTSALHLMGRQMYPAISAISLGLVAGWTALVPRSLRSRTVAIAISGLMVVFAAWAWLFTGMYAYSANPRLDEQALDRLDIQRLDWQVGGVATLLGYRISQTEVAPGDFVDVTLYWRVEQTPDKNFSDYVQFIDRSYGQNEIVASRDTFPGLGNDPTIFWQPGEIMADTIPVLFEWDGRTPLQLDVIAGLYDLEKEEPLPVTGPDGSSIGDPLLTRMTFRPPSNAAGEPEISERADFEGGVSLLGYDLSEGTLPSEELSLTLYWISSGPLPIDYVVFAHLFDADTLIIAQGDAPPVDGRLPTTLWSEGDVIVDKHIIPLPAELPPGTYNIRVGLYDPATGIRLPRAGSAGDQVVFEGALTVK
jgi:hypothetical protein